MIDCDFQLNNVFYFIHHFVLHAKQKLSLQQLCVVKVTLLNTFY